MGCPVFNSMGAFIRNILAFVLALYWPLHSIHRLLPIAHCSLLIAHCKLFHPPPKEIPRRRPPGIPYLQYRMQYWGPAPGKVWAGEAPEGPASPKGFTGWDGPGKFEADFSSGE